MTIQLAFTVVQIGVIALMFFTFAGPTLIAEVVHPLPPHITKWVLVTLLLIWYLLFIPLTLLAARGVLRFSLAWTIFVAMSYFSFNGFALWLTVRTSPLLMVSDIWDVILFFTLAIYWRTPRIVYK